MNKLVTMPDHLYKSLKKQAEKNNRSVNGEIVNIIVESVSIKPKGKTLHKEKRKV